MTKFKDGAFGVYFSNSQYNGTTEVMKDAFLAIAKKYDLSIEGIDVSVHRGMEHAGRGNLVCFGTSSYADVTWVENPEYSLKKGLTKILNLEDGWDEIQKALSNYIEKNAGWETSNGWKVKEVGDAVTLSKGSNKFYLKKAEIKELFFNV